jgi:8-oxo-dGTP pyrophosphatase MutT (NUDIX family)
MKHNASHILLYDSERRFLLQHRTSDAKVLPNYWAFFGGGIKNNETPEDAARRETFEELGYKIKNLEFLLGQSFNIENIYGYRYIYVDAFYDNKTKLQLKEGQGWGWFNIFETTSLKMIDLDRYVIEMLKRYLDKGCNNGKMYI